MADQDNSPRIFNPQDAPYSEEAEEAVIGAVLINPDALPGIAATLRHDDFYFLRHQYIWQVLEALYKERSGIDYVTILTRLKEWSLLDEIGGLPYLTRLINNTPTSIHAQFYADIVTAAALRRRLLVLGDEIKALAMNEQLDIQTVLSGVMDRAIQAARYQNGKPKRTKTLFEALNEHFDLVEEGYNPEGKFPGIPSLIPEVNEWLNGGYWNGQLIVDGGRPGTGKSSFLMSEAFNAVMRGYRVAYFSLEMPVRSIVGVFLSAQANIPGHQRMLRGKMSKVEYSRYVETSGNLASLYGDKLFIDDSPSLNPSQLYMKVQEIQLRYGKLDAVFVDYLQLMNAGEVEEEEKKNKKRKARRINNRDQEIGYITKSLKEMAMEFELPVLTASQFNRALKPGQEPNLTHLRESGNIENDSDVILALHNPNPRRGFSIVTKLKLLALKIRDGDSSKYAEVYFEGAKKQVTPLEPPPPVQMELEAAPQ